MRTIKAGARAAQAAWVDDQVGVLVAPAGPLLTALRFTIVDGTIVAIDAVQDPAQLAAARARYSALM